MAEKDKNIIDEGDVSLPYPPGEGNSEDDVTSVTEDSYSFSPLREDEGDINSPDDEYHEIFSEDNNNGDSQEEYKSSADSPQWDDSYNEDFHNDSVYGDPNNVALPDEGDIFSDGFDNSEGYTPFSPLPEDDTEEYRHNRNSGSGGAFWWIVGGVSIATMALVTWGSLWLSTGEMNPVSAISGTSSPSSSSSSISPMQSIQEDSPSVSATTPSPSSVAPGNSHEEDRRRIEELESSLTSAIDEAERARNDNNARKPSTVTKNSTATSTRVETRTQSRTVTNTHRVTLPPRTVTNTHRVTLPPRTVTRTNTVRVPGPERVVTTTVPSGRVTTTITTTVVERWG